MAAAREIVVLVLVGGIGSSVSGGWQMAVAQEIVVLELVGGSGSGVSGAVSGGSGRGAAAAAEGLLRWLASWWQK